MTNEKQAKKLEQIRALLAKADSTDYPAEAETFRAKADELMTSYAIEAWMVEEGSGEARPVPGARLFSLGWYWNNPRRDELWDLFHAVAYHCRCSVVWWDNSDDQNVVGLPADLDYFDMLFTSLMLEMGKGLEPRPSPGETVEQNSYRLRSAGMGWFRLAELLFEAGLIEVPRGVMTDKHDNMLDGATPWSRLDHATQTAMKNRLASVTRNYRRKEGLPDYTRSHPSVYQRSFAMGFVKEIKRRFRVLRERAEQPSGGTGTELVLRDIRDVVKAEAHALFGEPPKGGRSVSRDLRVTQAGLDAGAQAGREANLSNSGARRVGGRKEIGR